MSSRAHNADPAEGRASGGATPAHDRLGVLVGAWETVGESCVEEGGDTLQLRATDRYEWLPGGHFLIHHVDGTMGGQPVQALELIGHDPDRGDYFSHSYDNGGRTAAYRMRLDGLRWTIVGDTERFEGRFTDDRRVLRGEWERMEEGRWAPWMTLSLTRV